MSSRFLPILAALAITSACNGSDEQAREANRLIRPEQVRADLEFPRDGKEKISALAARLANELGMILDQQTFEFGGEDGSDIAYLVSDDDTAVMFRSDFDRTDVPDNVPVIAFSKNSYVVSVYRTSNRTPEHGLREIYELLQTEAAKLGGTLRARRNQSRN